MGGTSLHTRGDDFFNLSYLKNFAQNELSHIDVTWTKLQYSISTIAVHTLPQKQCSLRSHGHIILIN
jgi:hypothetical protein